MIILNDSMTKRIDFSDDEQNHLVESICDDIVSHIVYVNDCLIYYQGDIASTYEIDWKELLRVNKDYTGCEMFFNEILVSREIFAPNLLIRFLNTFRGCLHDIRPYLDYCILASYDSDLDAGVLRFHTFRESEGLWLPVIPFPKTKPFAYLLPDNYFSIADG